VKQITKDGESRLGRPSLARAVQRLFAIILAIVILLAWIGCNLAQCAFLHRNIWHGVLIEGAKAKVVLQKR
jgi:hypothetical protein